jgi:hypothetical protein
MRCVSPLRAFVYSVQVSSGARSTCLPRRWSLPVAELDHPALAAPGLDRVVALPPGIVDGQHQAIPGGVLGALVGARGVVVEEVRQRRLGRLDALPPPFGVGGAQVGFVDHFQPARAAQLRQHLLAGLGVDDLLQAPPAALHQPGAQVVDEGLQGGALGERGIDFGADVGQEVEFQGLGDGERGLVFLLPDIEIREANLVALLAEEFNGRRRGQELEVEVDHAQTLFPGTARPAT